MNSAVAYACVIGGAACWGVTGLFVQQLYGYGFTPWQVVTARLSLSSIILFLVLLVSAREYLKIRLRDFPYFFVLGVVSIALFNWFYFAVMERATVAIAVVFIYTSPIFAAIIARIFFKEKLTPQKGTAIVFTIVGCALAIGLFPAGGVSITISTLLLGLLAGLFCSSYSLIGKYISGLYHPFTMTFYAIVAGSIFTLPTSGIWEHHELLLTGAVWIPLLGISIVSTIFAYIFFTLGLYYVESSKAVILSSVELIISVVISFYVLNELLTGWQAAGIALMIGSIILTVVSFQRRVKQLYPEKDISWQ
ncbi:DMT family transporter [Alkalicoccus halolimnae]|uniref:DMT family transporter n=1 Tax=Alkalicoccus halolimnae TaxID=1667239 RepID=A0A5C7FN03_9BACI|nr:DMT family transporter [Alkalicoccus halolimnae]TXF86145.1 EamA family transporter [Alkalicoccus halolimnae]